jgi:hypothetical protein
MAIKGLLQISLSGSLIRTGCFTGRTTASCDSGRIFDHTSAVAKIIGMEINTIRKVKEQENDSPITFL